MAELTEDGVLTVDNDNPLIGNGLLSPVGGYGYDPFMLRSSPYIAGLLGRDTPLGTNKVQEKLLADFEAAREQAMGGTARQQRMNRFEDTATDLFGKIVAPAISGFTGTSSGNDVAALARAQMMQAKQLRRQKQADAQTTMKSLADIIMTTHPFSTKNKTAMAKSVTGAQNADVNAANKAGTLKLRESTLAETINKNKSLATHMANMDELSKAKIAESIRNHDMNFQAKGANTQLGYARLQMQQDIANAQMALRADIQNTINNLAQGKNVADNKLRLGKLVQAHAEFEAREARLTAEANAEFQQKNDQMNINATKAGAPVPGSTPQLSAPAPSGTDTLKEMLRELLDTKTGDALVDADTLLKRLEPPKVQAPAAPQMAQPLAAAPPPQINSSLAARAPAPAAQGQPAMAQAPGGAVPPPSRPAPTPQQHQAAMAVWQQRKAMVPQQLWAQLKQRFVQSFGFDPEPQVAINAGQ